jgi:hypothetical protein
VCQVKTPERGNQLDKEKIVKLLNRAEGLVQGYDLAGELHKAAYLLEREIEYDKKNEKPVGICPACGESVFNSRETDGPVWTCPCDLNKNNPFWQPSDVTEEMMEKDGCYSYCWSEHGGYCEDHMPLHSECYDKGNY